MLALVLPGAALYGFNFLGVEDQTFILIFGQLLPFFMIPFLPFAFGDNLAVKFDLLDTEQSLQKFKTGNMDDLNWIELGEDV